MSEGREGPGRDRLDARAEASALAELALCENLSQTSGWAAKWSAELAHADAALLWAPDPVHPLYLCIGAHGEGAEKFLRRSVPKGEGFVGALTVDRKPVLLQRTDFASSSDPWLKNLPDRMESCLAVPLEAEATVVGLLALLFRKRPAASEALGRLQGFVEHAAPALSRALRAERKTVGMLHAIERLTNLYDLSKAFGSTIDHGELTALIARKAGDMATAEVCSLWSFEPRESEVVLSATAVNENYDVDNPPDCRGRVARRRRPRGPDDRPPQPPARDRPPFLRKPRLHRSLRDGPSPRGGGVRRRRARSHEQAGPPSRVHRGGRGAAPGPRRDRRSALCATRGSTRRRRRSRSSTPFSLSAARSRRPSTSTR